MSSAPIRKTLTFTGTTALLVVALTATGCGSARLANGSPRSGRNAAAAWHQVVVCARAHGMPNLPDPQISATGKAIFPSGLNIPDQTRRACQSLYDRLVATGETQGPSRAQMAELLRFARCMRRQGVVDWPDPRPDGTFVPDPRISHLLKSAIRTQLNACEHYNPDPRGRVYFSHP